jgi:hypothetical protein
MDDRYIGGLRATFWLDIVYPEERLEEKVVKPETVIEEKMYEKQIAKRRGRKPKWWYEKYGG